MNFKVLLLLFCTQIFVINSIKACTMCGSAASNTFTGSLQSFDKNFIGTRYNYRQFSIFKEGSILKEEADENIPGYLSTQEIFAGFYPIKKLQIFAILPYHFYNSKDIHQSGLGDATLLANYNLFSLTAKNNCCIKYSLNLGAGLKLPTGKVKNDNTSVNSLQLVSGSLDYLFLTSFKMSYDKFTLVADGQYALTSPDKNNYRFGDRMATAINIFYNYSPTNELNILPNLGAAFTSFNRDKKEEKYIPETGGENLWANIGVDIILKGKMNFGVKFSTPLYQKSIGRNLSELKRMQVQMIYLF